MFPRCDLACTPCCMTVTPRNIGEVADVVRTARDMGFRMFSFQPAAYIGHPARWREDLRAIGGDDVWTEIERGVGARLHRRALQIGDPRCNRTAYGAWAGERYVPLLDEDDPRDARALQTFVASLGGMDFDVPRHLLAARLLRAIARHPGALPVGAPESGELVPACAQHAALDPAEMARLARQLPMAQSSPSSHPREDCSAA